MNEVKALTPEERGRFKKALHGRNKLLYIAGASTGLRVSDLLALNTADIAGQQALTVRESKRGARRTITISKTLQAAVQAELKAGTIDAAGPLFPSRKGGRPLSRAQAYRILNDAAKRAGIDGAIGGHTLRKTFGLALYEQGVDITRIMAILGQKAPAVTLRYIGITAQEIAESYEAIEI
ncbi:tyrosine-type recombinase/integrase [Alkalicoccus chagannorensis]|uniref:tyrosine-type recombinase/integrase n=1 Tax=Alkalicoccus chagannorensis TaxID=427072 RepID=UPI0004027E92|nr:tyrosine-type recombinase/integrase [Alkalicoccus chagannorensis]